jgi:hypothetical protein
VCRGQATADFLDVERVSRSSACAPLGAPRPGPRDQRRDDPAKSLFIDAHLRISLQSLPPLTPREFGYAGVRLRIY